MNYLQSAHINLQVVILQKCLNALNFWVIVFRTEHLKSILIREMCHTLLFMCMNSEIHIIVKELI